MCSPPDLTFVCQAYESLSSNPIDFMVSFFHFSGISYGLMKDSLPNGLSLPHLGHLTMVPKGMASPTCTTIGNVHPQHLIHLTYLISWCISFLLNQGQCVEFWQLYCTIFCKSIQLFFIYSLLEFPYFF